MNERSVLPRDVYRLVNQPARRAVQRFAVRSSFQLSKDIFHDFDLESDQGNHGPSFGDLNHGFGRFATHCAVATNPAIDLVVLCSPNNPTGRVISRELLQDILRAADAHGAYVVLDECFINLTEFESSAGLIQDFDNLIVVKALTKSHAMAGFRVGYCLCGDAELLGSLSFNGAPWAVSSPAQVAGIAALGVPNYLKLTREYVATERARLEEGLCECGMTVVPSHANFILFQSPAPLYDALLDRGYVIRRCGNFRGLDNSWYRIAVRTTVQNKGFLAALREVTE